MCRVETVRHISAHSAARVDKPRGAKPLVVLECVGIVALTFAYDLVSDSLFQQGPSRFSSNYGPH